MIRRGRASEQLGELLKAGSRVGLLLRCWRPSFRGGVASDRGRGGGAERSGRLRFLTSRWRRQGVGASQRAAGDREGR